MTPPHSAYIGTKNHKVVDTMFSVSVVDYNAEANNGWHYHDKMHLLAVLRGGNRESRKNTVRKLSRGDIASYHAGEIHRNEYISNDSRNVIVEFEEGFFSEETSFQSMATNPTVFQTLTRVYGECLNDEADQLHSITESIYSLLGHSLSAYTPGWVSTAKELLDDRWNEFIPLEAVASKLKVHPVTVSSYFSRAFDCTMSEYMRRIKVERAITRLLRSSNSISSIAHQCGFSDHSHMTRLIKCYTGFTPRGLRSL